MTVATRLLKRVWRRRVASQRPSAAGRHYHEGEHAKSQRPDSRSYVAMSSARLAASNLISELADCPASGHRNGISQDIGILQPSGSQGCVSKLVARYRAAGETAFEARPRRPNTSPGRSRIGPRS
jgi:hypothetical protein